VDRWPRRKLSLWDGSTMDYDFAEAGLMRENAAEGVTTASSTSSGATMVRMEACKESFGPYVVLDCTQQGRDLFCSGGDLGPLALAAESAWIQPRRQAELALSTAGKAHKASCIETRSRKGLAQ
jgi:hypothetical protein